MPIFVCLLFSNSQWSRLCLYGFFQYNVFFKAFQKSEEEERHLFSMYLYYRVKREQLGLFSYCMWYKHGLYRWFLSHKLFMNALVQCILLLVSYVIQSEQRIKLAIVYQISLLVVVSRVNGIKVILIDLIILIVAAVRSRYQ